MRDLARTFAALADATRLEMLALLLKNDELCVCDFVGALGITQSKASRHLRYLWNAGLLSDRQAGQWVYYRMSPELDAEGKAVVAMLRNVCCCRDLADLEQRLRKWLKAKCGGGVCGPLAPGRDGAKGPGRRKA